MSNFLLRDPDCVLIHIPKNGGSTIRKGLWQGRYDGPVYGRMPEDWRPFFKFAFVRHPLDRLVSAWADFTQLRSYSGAIEAFVDIVVDDAIIFDDRRRTAAERIRHHTIPQTHPFNCLDEADHVGRFETYAEDLAGILKRVGLDARDFPAIRKTDRAGWREHLQGDALAKAVEFYREDFRQLGYTPA